MRCASRFSIGILLFLVSSISATEQPLGPGYFKWLLHLGQTPADSVLHDLLHVDQFESLGRESSIALAPGQILDFAENL